MSAPALPHADRDRVVELLQGLIEIDSVNPALPDATHGEVVLAEHVADFFTQLGLEVERSDALPGRPNVLAQMPSPVDDAPVLLLEAHSDTVTIANFPDGLVPRIDGPRLYGRGACDTKGGLAAAMHAMELLAAAEQLPRASVHLLAAIDEEVAYRGVLHYLDQGHRPDASIVIEPTSLAPVIATKGCVRLRIGTRGRSAHTSQPQNGINAITAMIDVVAALTDWADKRTETHPLCGAPTMVISRIGGGTQINIVPEDCWIELDHRTLPSDRPDEIIDEIDAVLRAQGSNARIDEVLVTDYGLDTPPTSPIALTAASACASLGVSDTLIGVPYGSDASKLSALGGVPSIVLGPGDIAQAHAEDEWIEIDQLTAAADLYLRCAVALVAPERLESER